MKKPVLYLLLFISVCLQAQNQKAKLLIKEVVEKYSNASSISYDANYKIKFFDDTDTVKVSGTCKLIRDNKDTIFAGKIWLATNNSWGSFYRYYKPGVIYTTKKESDTITQFDPLRGETWAFSGNTDSDLLNTYFRKPEYLFDYLKKDSIVTFRETELNNIAFTVMEIHFPDEPEDDITNTWKKIFINNKTKQIEKIQYYAQLLDQNQYNEWNLKNIKFNKVTEKEIEKDFKKASAGKKIVKYIPKTEEEKKLLANGTTAPDFQARLYPDDKIIKLSDYKGKVVLLDYWYMSCFYCVKSMPALNRLQEKYKDQIVVLGVNPYDESEKQKAKIPAFIKRNNPLYPLAFIDFDITAQYNIQAYPTLYIIDREGLIHESHIGYSDTYEENLDKIISELVK